MKDCEEAVLKLKAFSTGTQKIAAPKVASAGAEPVSTSAGATSSEPSKKAKAKSAPKAKTAPKAKQGPKAKTEPKAGKRSRGRGRA